MPTMPLAAVLLAVLAVPPCDAPTCAPLELRGWVRIEMDAGGRVTVRPQAGRIFVDGFETGDTGGWR